MTRKEIVAAIAALLDAANVDAYEVDDLKALPRLPDNYAEIHLSHRQVGATRANGISDVRGWRLQLRASGKTVGNAHVLLDRIHAALYGARVGNSTPLIAGPVDVPDYDDGWYAALSEFTFTI